MCRQKAYLANSTSTSGARHLVKENADEVFEASSEGESGSECESEPETGNHVPQQSSRKEPAQQEQQRKLQQHDTALPGQVYGARATPSGTNHAGNNSTSLPRCVLPQQQPPKSAPQHYPLPGQSSGLMGLVAHLRSDNERLREALVQAQREAESAIVNAERAGYAGAGMDFAHLLSLVKEFGDLTGSEQLHEDEKVDCASGLGLETMTSTLSSTTAEIFSMDSPRGREDKELEESSHDSAMESDGPGEAEDLRKQLEASRREVEQLKALLAVRDAELREARDEA